MNDNRAARGNAVHAGLFAVSRRFDLLGENEDIALRINPFLDPLPLWSFERALARGYAQLVARIVIRDHEILPDGPLLGVLYNERAVVATRAGDLHIISRT